MIDLAIEIGSCYTTIYKKQSGLVLKEASLVAFNKTNTTNIIAFGNKAKKMLGKTDASTSVICPIKNGIISDSTLCYELLNGLLQKIDKKIKLLKFNVVVCTKIGTTCDDQEAFRQLFYKLGALKVEFVPTAITSLIGAGVNVERPTGYMSLNLGGGTCEIAVVSMNTVINGLCLCFGGLKIDEAICLYVEKFLSLTISPHICEYIKEEIGSLYAHDNSCLEISGTDVNDYTPKNDIIKSSDITKAFEFYFEKIIVAIKNLLNACSPDIISDIAQNGLYVTGGLAKLSGVEAFLRKHLCLPIIVCDDCENACIIGAGTLLSNKAQKNIIIKQM